MKAGGSSTRASRAATAYPSSQGTYRGQTKQPLRIQPSAIHFEWIWLGMMVLIPITTDRGRWTEDGDCPGISKTSVHHSSHHTYHIIHAHIHFYPSPPSVMFRRRPRREDSQNPCTAGSNVMDGNVYNCITSVLLQLFYTKKTSHKNNKQLNKKKIRIWNLLVKTEMLNFENRFGISCVLPVLAARGQCCISGYFGFL